MGVITMPDLAWERRLGGIVCGVDEVGRGPLAGPVVAAAVVLPEGDLPRELRGLNDSKALPSAKRLAYAACLKECAAIGIGAASREEIDRLNILQATLLAMRRAVAALGFLPDAALIDGNRAPALPCRTQTLIGGDALSLSIAAASVVAKVTRDRAMAALAQRYAAYGWDRNAGYGTAAHLQAILDHGITPHHRRSFAPVRQALLRDA
jgi:ribonuclease HII